MNRRTVLYCVVVLLLVTIARFIGDARDYRFAKSLSGTTNLRNTFTPREGLDEATRIARRWDEQCFLQCVRIAFLGDLDHDPGMTPDGRPVPPSGWMYRFMSRERGRFLELTLTPDGRCLAESSSATNYADSEPLPAAFLDSPAAFKVAEDSFGATFRGETKLFRYYAQVTTWKNNVGGPEDPVRHRPNWQIQYLATRGRDRVDLCLMIDAITGQLLTAQRFENSKATLLRSSF